MYFPVVLTTSKNASTARDSSMSYLYEIKGSEQICPLAYMSETPKKIVFHVLWQRSHSTLYVAIDWLAFNLALWKLMVNILIIGVYYLYPMGVCANFITLRWSRFAGLEYMANQDMFPELPFLQLQFKGLYGKMCSLDCIWRCVRSSLKHNSLYLRLLSGWTCDPSRFLFSSLSKSQNLQSGGPSSNLGRYSKKCYIWRRQGVSDIV